MLCKNDENHTEVDLSYSEAWIRELRNNLDDIEVNQLRSIIGSDLAKRGGFNAARFACDHTDVQIMSRVHFECGEDTKETLILLGYVAQNVASRSHEDWLLLTDVPECIVIVQRSLAEECRRVHALGLQSELIASVDNYWSRQAEAKARLSAATSCPYDAIGKLSGTAKVLMEVASSLRGLSVDSYIEDFLEVVVNADVESQRLMALFVINELEDRAVSSFAESIKGIDQRILQLVSLANSVRPMNRKCLDYLKRVSKSYLLGLYAECTLWCRSVIEQELDSHVSRDDLKGMFGAKRRSFTLEEYIILARKRRLLSEESASKADALRLSANKIVHRQLHGQQVQDALVMITSSLRVIDELNSCRGK
jgi:hypothetical protein